MSGSWIEGCFESWDKEKIFFRIWDPAGARGTIILLHGFGEHSGRYVKFSESISGFPVRMAIMDHRGMGRSGGARVTVGSFEDYLRDITAFREHLSQHFRVQGPVVLLGHSLGGLLAVEWAIRNPSSLKALILTSPFLGLRGLSALGLINRAVSFFCPGFIYRNPVIPKHLTHDAAEVAAYRADPLIERKISARLIGLLMERMRAIRKLAPAFPFPCYVLLAGDERIVDPRAARRFFEKVRATKKELVEFDGFYHEIFREIGQEKVFNVLKTIIEDCV
ncbi:MAG TPA: lysophospholipase [Candidatus Omnitrophota bacterium]|nr:lysophospholipase [Candidatus Omnitrophota bacterium]HPS37078.1 lysophospholipase [Candidatus Omnitrophota bacterium]